MELHDIIVVITPPEIKYNENISSELFIKNMGKYGNLTIVDLTILPMPEIKHSESLDFN